MSKEPGFVVTDSDFLQCCKQIGDNIYKLVQYNEVPIFDAPFRVVEATIDLSDYSNQELLDYLKPYGYADVSELGDMGMVAEIIFETDMLEFDESGRYLTQEEAGRAIENITGLDLREYYVEKAEIIYTAESGKEYTRADFERIADEALAELSEKNPEEYQRIMHGIIPQAKDILRDQLISLADWQSVETLADEFLREPEVHFPPEDEWTAEDWKALVEKSYQEEPKSLLSTVYTKEDIASFKTSFREKDETPGRQPGEVYKDQYGVRVQGIPAVFANEFAASEYAKENPPTPSLTSEVKDARAASGELSQSTESPEKGRDVR